MCCNVCAFFAVSYPKSGQKILLFRLAGGKSSFPPATDLFLPTALKLCKIEEIKEGFLKKKTSFFMVRLSFTASVMPSNCASQMSASLDLRSNQKYGVQELVMDFLTSCVRNTDLSFAKRTRLRLVMQSSYSL